jgi:hypothetical protein
MYSRCLKSLENSVSSEAKKQISLAKEYDHKTAAYFQKLHAVVEPYEQEDKSSETGAKSISDLIRVKTHLADACTQATQAMDAQLESRSAIEAIDEELGENVGTLEKSVRILEITVDLMEDISALKDSACGTNSG